MSNSWIRGQRCGVDNCRSKYYRSIDGQRVCQFGHISDAYLEINDEEDDNANFVSTKRLTQLSQSSQRRKKMSFDKNENRDSSGSERAYGSKGRELFLKTIQYLLKIQVRCLIERHGFPEAYETVVKRFWAEFLKKRHIYQERGDESQTESEYTTADEYADEEDQRMPQKHSFSLHPDVTLAILYISCRHMMLPVYSDDFVMWIMKSELPYTRSSYKLPPYLAKTLASRYLSLLHVDVPVYSQIAWKVPTIVELLEISDLRLNYEPLLFRVINELVLPPEVYPAVKKLIEMEGASLNYLISSKRSEFQAAQFPETVVLAMIIHSSKLYFAQPHYGRTPEVNDWKIWKKLVLKLNDKYDNTQRGFDNFMASILLTEDPDKDILEWDDDSTNRYLDWFSHNIVDSQLPSPDDLPTDKRRLFNIVTESEVLEKQTPVFTSFRRVDFTKLKESYDKLMVSTTSKPEEDSMLKSEIAEIHEILVEHFSKLHGIHRKHIDAAVFAISQLEFQRPKRKPLPQRKSRTHSPA